MKRHVPKMKRFKNVRGAQHQWAGPKASLDVLVSNLWGGNAGNMGGLDAKSIQMNLQLALLEKEYGALPPVSEEGFAISGVKWDAGLKKVVCLHHTQCACHSCVQCCWVGLCTMNAFSLLTTVQVLAKAHVRPEKIAGIPVPCKKHTDFQLLDRNITIKHPDPLLAFVVHRLGNLSCCDGLGCSVAVHLS